MAVLSLAACITWSACVFCLVALLTGFVLGDDKKIHSNVNMTAEAGTSVTLSCRPVQNEMKVMWTEKFSTGPPKDVAMDCEPINGYANKVKLSCNKEWRNLTIIEVSNSTIHQCIEKEGVDGGFVHQFLLTLTESQKPSFDATTSVDNPISPVPSIDNDASTSMQPAAARNFENQTVNIVLSVLSVLVGLTILGGFGCFLYLRRKIRKYGARHKQLSPAARAVEVRRHSTPRSDVNQQIERFIPDQRSRAMRASPHAVSNEKLQEVLVDSNGDESRSNVVGPDAVGKKNLQEEDLTLTVPDELLETIIIKASISLYSRNTFQPDAVTKAESVKLTTKICHRWWEVLVLRDRYFLRKQLKKTIRTIPRLVTVIDESSARKTGDFVVVNGHLHSTSFSSKEKLVYDANPPFTTICDIIAEHLDIPNEPQRSELTIIERNGSYYVVDFRDGTNRKVDREAMGHVDMMTSYSQNLNHDNGQRTQNFEACQINELSKDRRLVADRQRRVILTDSNFVVVKVLLDFKEYTLNDLIVVPWRIHYDKTNRLLFVGSRDNQIHVFNWYNGLNTKPCALKQ